MSSFPLAGSDPPKEKARPKAETLGTGKVSGLDKRPDSSLRANQPKCKQVYARFRDRFVGSLTAELEFWLRSILAGQSQRSESATLGGTLLAMQLVRRTQFRRRRSKPKRSQAWTTIRSLPRRRP
jgi:hypothetical protein